MYNKQNIIVLLLAHIVIHILQMFF